MQPYIELVKKKLKKKLSPYVRPQLLQFPVQLFFFGGGISPAGRGIYLSPGVRNLDFFLCTIPTVGLYGKLGEIAATHNWNIKHIHGAAAATLRRLHRRESPLSYPAVTRRHRCCPPAVTAVRLPLPSAAKMWA